MEELFAAVRDITLTRRLSDDDAGRVRRLIDGLRAPPPGAAAPDWDACKAQLRQGEAEGGRGAGKRAGRSEAGGGTEASSEALHTQLQSAKALLQQRLKTTRPAW